MTEPGGVGRARPRRAMTGGAASREVGELDPEARIAELEQRLERLEGSPGLRQRGRSMLDRLFPPEAATHFRNAGRENLLGMRSIVDYWIQRLDESESRAEAGRRADRETIVIE